MAGIKTYELCRVRIKEKCYALQTISTAVNHGVMNPRETIHDTLLESTFSHEYLHKYFRTQKKKT